MGRFDTVFTRRMLKVNKNNSKLLVIGIDRLWHLDTNLNGEESEIVIQGIWE